MGTREVEAIDVVIVVALEDELDALIEEGGGAAAWREIRDGDGLVVHVTTLLGPDAQSLRVAAAWTGAMGTTAAAARAAALIRDLRPSCVAMCGICAGKRGDVSLGDVIVADRLYSYDHGKLVAGDGKTAHAFYHDLATYNLERAWHMDAAAFRHDLRWAEHLLPLRPPPKDLQQRWLLHAVHAHERGEGPSPVAHPERAAMFRIDAARGALSDWADRVRELRQQGLVDLAGGGLKLTECGRQQIEEDRVLYPDGLPREPPFRVHVGPIATGNAVVEDPDIFQRIKRIERKTLGVEMEASAIGYLGEALPRRAIVVKAVSDHADHDKDDRFREFACRAAAAWLLAFLRRHLAPEPAVRIPDIDCANTTGPRSPFPDLASDHGRSSVPARASDDDPFRISDLQRCVQRVVGLRMPGAVVVWKRGPEAAPAPVRSFLEVQTAGGGYTRAYPVAVIDGTVDALTLEGFIDQIVTPYRADTPYVEPMLVHTAAVAREVVDEARVRGVRLESLVELQGLLDFRPYVAEQTRVLEHDAVYPSRLYVPQRLAYGIGRDERCADDALDAIDRWLGVDGPQLLVVLGDFGTGKTFLMHELALRLGRRDSATVPVLIELRRLEKTRSLDVLLGQHFVPERGMRRFDYDAFRYMLEEGRVALLFDGFDELALRVTYETATEHLDTVLQAAIGKAKVVITSRTQHFLNDQQVVRALGERVTQRGFRLARLLPFDEQRVRQFLSNRFDDSAAASGWFELLGEVKDLLGLSYNPRMLSFIAELPEQDLRRAAEGGEITAATLYRVLLEKWLGHEERRDHPAGIEPGLSAQTRWKAATDLAHLLWPRKERTITVGEIPVAILDEVARLVDRPLGTDAVAHKLGSGTLLTRDEDGRFSFIHQSIIEWFVANSAGEELRAGREPVLLADADMSDLMVDFLAALAGRDPVLAWARRAMSALSGDVLVANANRLLRRLRETIKAAASSAGRRGLDAVLEMSGQDLRGQDFTGTSYLRGASLEGSNFSEASLVRADLSDARLVHARLQRANLEGANLRGADLRGADLSFARLIGADFTGAKLAGTTLRYAKLVGATLDPEALQTVDAYGAAAVRPQRFDLAFDLPESICTSLAWSPDGALLALGYRDGAVILADAATGRSLRQLESHPTVVTGVAFSPGGALVASASNDHTVRLWDPQSGALTHALEGHTAPVTAIAFTPDRQLLASASADRTVRLWDVVLGIQMRAIQSQTELGIASVALSPDGELLAFSSHKTIELWNLRSNVRLRSLAGVRGDATALAFSPDGKLLVSGSTGGAVVAWRLDAGVLESRLQAHFGPVTCVAFSPQGSLLASGSADTRIQLRKAGGSVRRLEAVPAPVTSIAFSPDGKRLAAAYEDQSILLWKPDTGERLRALDRGGNCVHAVAFSPDGKLLASASRDSVVRLWSTGTGALQRVSSHHGGSVNSVAFSSDGRLFASASSDQTVIVTSLAHASIQLDGHTDGVNTVALSPSGRLVASGSSDGVVRLWPTKYLAPDESQPPTDSTLRVHPDPKFHALVGHSARVNSVAFSPGGTLLASGAGDSTVRIWNVVNRTLARTLIAHSAPVHSVAFSPDRTLLASGSADTTIRLWERSGELRTRLDGHTAAVTCVAFSSDGKLLASSSFKSVKLWDGATGALRCSLEGHAHWINGLAFSPDGALLATGSSDGTIRLWSVGSALRHDGSERCLVILVPARDGWMAITPDGRYKRHGDAAKALGFSVGLCRFDPGELDDYPDTFAHPRRVPDEEPLFALERGGARRSV